MKKGYTNALGSQKIIKDHSLLGHEDIRHKIQILPQLRELIPSLLPDELTQLEANIRKDGCREALLVWETRQGVLDDSEDTAPAYILVDGHNRYGICQRNNIDFRISLKSFSDLGEVRAFMIENQLGRRNLTPEQTAYLRGVRYNDEKGERGKYSRDDHKGQNVPYGLDTALEASESTIPASQPSTAQKLARQFNVSEKTIKRDAAFAAGVEKLATELKSDVLSGKTQISKTKLQQLGKSDVADGSITSPDAITTDTSSTPPVTDQDSGESIKINKRSATATMDRWRRRLKELTDQLSPTGSEPISLYDEIINCATKLRANLLESFLSKGSTFTEVPSGAYYTDPIVYREEFFKDPQEEQDYMARIDRQNARQIKKMQKKAKATQLSNEQTPTDQSL